MAAALDIAFEPTSDTHEGVDPRLMLLQVAALDAEDVAGRDAAEIGQQVAAMVTSVLGAQRAVLLIEGAGGLERLADSKASKPFATEAERSRRLSARDLPLPLLRRALEEQAAASCEPSSASKELLGCYVLPPNVAHARCELLTSDGEVVGLLYLELPYDLRVDPAAQAFVQLVASRSGTLVRALMRVSDAAAADGAPFRRDAGGPLPPPLDPRGRVRLVELISSILIDANAGGRWLRRDEPALEEAGHCIDSVEARAREATRLLMEA